MAQLDPAHPNPPQRNNRAPAPATPAPPIPATTQLLAVAWLRWRIFVNAFRRQTRGNKVGSLIVAILLRLILWPIVALWVIGPCVGSGFVAWTAVSQHHPLNLSMLLAGIAILWQFIAINGIGIAATASSFDHTSLLRFPLRFGRYLVLRLLLGLLTASTIVGCLTLISAAIGIAVADLALAPAAFLVLGIYAAMNIFFSRMIAVWLDRLLATRRAREIFTGLMALFFVSFQFLNFRRPAGHRTPAANVTWINGFLHGTNRFLQWLPPGFATVSIFPGHPLARLGQFAALLAWTGVFFAAFALRLHKQFLGEYLSEGAPRTAPARTHTLPSSPAAPEPATYNLQPATSFLSPIIAACLRKEWVCLRGNSNQLISMLTPLVFVIIFTRGILASHPSYLLPGAIGYAILGLLGTLYNIFGSDGAGVQLYLLSPVRLRDIVLAKNLASLALLLLEASLAWCLVIFLATVPIPLSAQLSAASWIVFVIFANLAFGTLRSIQAPRKVVVPGQSRQLRSSTASRTSGLIVLAILFGSILLQIPVALLCRHFNNPWLAVLIFLPLAAAAIAAYALLLANADNLIQTHRDTFAEDLCGD
jgi:ABC-2 type transport system permease protein